MAYSFFEKVYDSAGLGAIGLDSELVNAILEVLSVYEDER